MDRHETLDDAGQIAADSSHPGQPTLSPQTGDYSLSGPDVPATETVSSPQPSDL